VHFGMCYLPMQQSSIASWGIDIGAVGYKRNVSFRNCLDVL